MEREAWSACEKRGAKRKTRQLVGYERVVDEKREGRRTDQRDSLGLFDDWLQAPKRAPAIDGGLRVETRVRDAEIRKTVTQGEDRMMRRTMR